MNLRQPSHFVIGKGLLLREHKMVPAARAERVTDDKVYLSVGAELFERLPDYNRD